MKKHYRLTILLILTLAAGVLTPVRAYAGKSLQISEPVTTEGSLNQTEWYFSDGSIECYTIKEATEETPGVYVVKLPGSGASDTGFISKIISHSDKSVDEMTGVEAELTLESMEEGSRLIFAFGLSNIEARSGEKGNVEIALEGGSEIKAGAVAYAEDSVQTLAESRSCGITKGKAFKISASVTPDGLLTADVNGQRLCSAQLPVSGEGRFGVLRVGSSEAVISSLSFRSCFYDTPENSNIVEDFERGDLNLNEFYCTSRYNGLDPSYIRVEDWDGNKVLRFKNIGLAHMGTVYKYSNFEITFDIPYFLNENVYDENGYLIGKPSTNIGVSFGSPLEHPEGYAYVNDTDLIVICPDRLYSYSRKNWSKSLSEVGMGNLSKNEGYSFKFTLIDGHSVCQIKPLSSDKWVTVGECDYNQKTGHIFIWSTGNSDCTIDNLKITNLDKNPVLIDPGYTSSIITAEDYQLTEEEKTLTFREETAPAGSDTSEGENENGEIPWFIVWCGGAAVVIALAGFVAGTVIKSKKGREVKADEKN